MERKREKEKGTGNGADDGEPRRKENGPICGNEESSEFLEQIDKDSDKAKALISQLQKANLKNESEGLWEVQSFHVVKNKEIEKKYQEKKKLMMSQGRTDEEVQDIFVFAIETWSDIVKICKYGPECNQRRPGTLGENYQGLHYSRFCDVLLKFIAFNNRYLCQRFLLVLKGMTGKSNHIGGCTMEVHPKPKATRHYDSHISRLKPSLDMHIKDAMVKNYIFFYEFDEKMRYTVKNPAHIAPVAVLGISRTYRKISHPYGFAENNKHELRNHRKTGRCKKEKNIPERNSKSKSSKNRAKNVNSERNNVENKGNHSGGKKETPDQERENKNSTDQSKNNKDPPEKGNQPLERFSKPTGSLMRAQSLNKETTCYPTCLGETTESDLIKKFKDVEKEIQFKQNRLIDLKMITLKPTELAGSANEFCSEYYIPQETQNVYDEIPLDLSSKKDKLFQCKLSLKRKVEELDESIQTDKISHNGTGLNNLGNTLTLQDEREDDCNIVPTTENLEIRHSMVNEETSLNNDTDSDNFFPTIINVESLARETDDSENIFSENSSEGTIFSRFEVSKETIEPNLFERNVEQHSKKVDFQNNTEKLINGAKYKRGELSLPAEITVRDKTLSNDSSLRDTNWNKKQKNLLYEKVTAFCCSETSTHKNDCSEAEGTNILKEGDIKYDKKQIMNTNTTALLSDDSFFSNESPKDSCLSKVNGEKGNHEDKLLSEVSEFCHLKNITNSKNNPKDMEVSKDKEELGYPKVLVLSNAIRDPYLKCMTPDKVSLNSNYLTKPDAKNNNKKVNLSKDDTLQLSTHLNDFQEKDVLSNINCSKEGKREWILSENTVLKPSENAILKNSLLNNVEVSKEESVKENTEGLISSKSNNSNNLNTTNFCKIFPSGCEKINNGSVKYYTKGFELKNSKTTAIDNNCAEDTIKANYVREQDDNAIPSLVKSNASCLSEKITFAFDLPVKYNSLNIGDNQKEVILSKDSSPCYSKSTLLTNEFSENKSVANEDNKNLNLVKDSVPCHSERITCGNDFQVEFNTLDDQGVTTNKCGNSLNKENLLLNTENLLINNFLGDSFLSKHNSKEKEKKLVLDIDSVTCHPRGPNSFQEQLNLLKGHDVKEDSKELLFSKTNAYLHLQNTCIHDNANDFELLESKCETNDQQESTLDEGNATWSLKCTSSEKDFLKEIVLPKHKDVKNDLNKDSPTALLRSNKEYPKNTKLPHNEDLRDEDQESASEFHAKSSNESDSANFPSKSQNSCTYADNSDLNEHEGSAINDKCDSLKEMQIKPFEPFIKLNLDPSENNEWLNFNNSSFEQKNKQFTYSPLANPVQTCLSSSDNMYDIPVRQEFLNHVSTLNESQSKDLLGKQLLLQITDNNSLSLQNELIGNQLENEFRTKRQHSNYSSEKQKHNVGPKTRISKHAKKDKSVEHDNKKHQAKSCNSHPKLKSIISSTKVRISDVHQSSTPTKLQRKHSHLLHTQKTLEESSNRSKRKKSFYGKKHSVTSSHEDFKNLLTKNKCSDNDVSYSDGDNEFSHQGFSRKRKKSSLEQHTMEHKYNEDPPSKKHQSDSDDDTNSKKTNKTKIYHCDKNNDKNDCSIDNTLSKAMTSLLKKVIVGKSNDDNTAEGKMADMVLAIMKGKIIAERNQPIEESYVNNDNRHENYRYQIPTTFYPKYKNYISPDYYRTRSRMPRLPFFSRGACRYQSRPYSYNQRYQSKFMISRRGFNIPWYARSRGEYFHENWGFKHFEGLLNDSLSLENDEIPFNRVQHTKDRFSPKRDEYLDNDRLSFRNDRYLEDDRFPPKKESEHLEENEMHFEDDRLFPKRDRHFKDKRISSKSDRYLEHDRFFSKQESHRSSSQTSEVKHCISKNHFTERESSSQDRNWRKSRTRSDRYLDDDSLSPNRGNYRSPSQTSEEENHISKKYPAERKRTSQDMNLRKSRARGNRCLEEDGLSPKRGIYRSSSQALEKKNCISKCHSTESESTSKDTYLRKSRARSERYPADDSLSPKRGSHRSSSQTSEEELCISRSHSAEKQSTPKGMHLRKGRGNKCLKENELSPKREIQRSSSQHRISKGHFAEREKTSQDINLRKSRGCSLDKKSHKSQVTIKNTINK